MEVIDKIAKNLENAARHAPVKEKHWVSINDKEIVKERMEEHFETVINRNKVTGDDIENDDRICDNLEVKEHLFREEELN